MLSVKCQMFYYYRTIDNYSLIMLPSLLVLPFPNTAGGIFPRHYTLGNGFLPIRRKRAGVHLPRGVSDRPPTWVFRGNAKSLWKGRTAFLIIKSLKSSKAVSLKKTLFVNKN